MNHELMARRMGDRIEARFKAGGPERKMSVSERMDHVDAISEHLENHEAHSEAAKHLRKAGDHAGASRAEAEARQHRRRVTAYARAHPGTEDIASRPLPYPPSESRVRAAIAKHRSK